MVKKVVEKVATSKEDTGMKVGDSIVFESVSAVKTRPPMDGEGDTVKDKPTMDEGDEDAEMTEKEQ